jgi:hypothetical protein
MSLHTILVAWHLMVIALGIGFAFSNFFNTHLARVSEENFQPGLALHRRMIGRIGDGVISLIWISGGLLLWLRGTEGLGVAFHLKMLAVVLLTLCHARARMLGEKMRREGHRNLLFEQGSMMLAGGVLALIAVFCAVLTFRG